MVRSAGARALVACAVGTLGVLALSACVLKADGFTGGTPESPDGGAAGGAEGGTNPLETIGPGGDGGGGITATDGGDAGSPNLLINGDFELGCAGWNASFGFVSEDTVAHSGAKSCKVCMDTNWEMTFTRDAALTGHKGETYVADVWLHGAAGSATMQQQGFRSDDLSLFWSGGGVDPTPGPQLDSTWLHASTLTTLSADETQLTFSFHMTQAGNPASVGDVICVYVDDAAIRKAQ